MGSQCSEQKISQEVGSPQTPAGSHLLRISFRDSGMRPKTPLTMEKSHRAKDGPWDKRAFHLRLRKLSLGQESEFQ